MIRASHLRWLTQLWPWRTKRFHLLGEYNALGRLRLVCADIVLLGGIGRSPHVPGDPYATAVNIGRRDLAEHLLALAGCTPASVEDLIEKKPTGDERP